jgi:trk system potassium uptake protein TrkH
MIWRGQPVAALILLMLAALMLVPAAVAWAQGDRASLILFLQSAGLTALAAGGLGVALRPSGPRRRPAARDELLTVLFLFAGAPVAAAAPIVLAQPALGWDGAYFEAVSMMTTTGGSAISDLRRAPDALHVWRLLLCWFGGLGTLVAAVAVFAPRNLGGLEVRVDERPGSVGRLAGTPAWAGGGGRPDAEARLGVAARAVAPVYLALTLALGAVFASIGLPPLRAAAQAAGVMSTSGVAVDALPFQGGFVAEAVALLFLAAAATRHAFQGGSAPHRLRRLRRDPEIELALIAVGIAAGWIFLRHFVGAAEADEAAAPREALEALWGALFTAGSFLSTAGYASAWWEGARDWSGLQSPGLLLLGLAAMGGGVASTAGGVKLLRSFALYQHGLREMARLAHPSAVTGHGEGARRVGFAGAQLAWLFLMLFLLGVGAAMLGLAATGVPLERALPAAIAAFSNTGPAYAAAVGPDAPGFAAMAAAPRLILSAAMVLGRVELLAVVALANPAYWRR